MLTGGERTPERMPLLAGGARASAARTPEHTGLQARASADPTASRVARQSGVLPRGARSPAGAGASTAAGCLHRRSPPSARRHHRAPGRALPPSLHQIGSRISRTNSCHGNRLEALEVWNRDLSQL